MEKMIQIQMTNIYIQIQKKYSSLDYLPDTLPLNTNKIQIQIPMTNKDTNTEEIQ